MLGETHAAEASAADEPTTTAGTKAGGECREAGKAREGRRGDDGGRFDNGRASAGFEERYPTEQEEKNRGQQKRGSDGKAARSSSLGTRRNDPVVATQHTR